MFYVFSLKNILKNLTIYSILGISIYSIFSYLISINTKDDIYTSNINKYYIALIIDDFGYSGEGTNEMINLPINFTGAVMPFSASSLEDSEKLTEAGKDIIIHLPMESLTGSKNWIGDKGIFLNMSDEQIKNTVNDAFDILKDAKGINNHMGSAIMEDKRALTPIIQAIKDRNLLFVDSVTTPNSKAEEICANIGIKCIKRDVFLDSTDDINKIKENLLKAEKIANEKGFAVAIGHVGPDGGFVTVNAIKDLYKEMERRGVEFVTISELSNILSN